MKRTYQHTNTEKGELTVSEQEWRPRSGRKIISCRRAKG